MSRKPRVILNWDTGNTIAIIFPPGSFPEITVHNFSYPSLEKQFRWSENIMYLDPRETGSTNLRKKKILDKQL